MSERLRQSRQVPLTNKHLVDGRDQPETHCIETLSLRVPVGGLHIGHRKNVQPQNATPLELCVHALQTDGQMVDVLSHSQLTISGDTRCGSNGSDSATTVSQLHRLKSVLSESHLDTRVDRRGRNVDRVKLLFNRDVVRGPR